MEFLCPAWSGNPDKYHVVVVRHSVVVAVAVHQSEGCEASECSAGGEAGVCDGDDAERGRACRTDGTAAQGGGAEHQGRLGCGEGELNTL